ncbi:MAG: POTRA domain-containing protein [Acidobacteriota bacterium]
MRIAFLLSILVLTAALAGAAPEDYEGKPVTEIAFEPALQPYSRAYLLDILPVKTGRPLELAGVRAAIERLYRTGRYADIRVDARAKDSGVVLTFITTGNYFIGRVSVSRTPTPPNQGVLVNATRLDLGSLYTPSAATQAVNNLQQVLRNNGFYRANIETEFEHDPATQQVKLRFIVKVGDRAKYTAPLVTGNPERSVEEIVKATHWKRRWFGWKTVTDARTQDGIQNVRRSYQKKDLLEARVSLEKAEWEPDTNRVRHTLDIDAGPKISIMTVGTKISRGKLKQLVPVFEEQSVDRDLLVEGANNIREYLEGKGYFDTKVDFEARTAPQDGAARASQIIEYRIERGERHKVTLIEIKGNRYFDTNTIRERMYIRRASLIQFRYGRFSESYLRHDADAIAALYRSNGFRDVEVKTRVQRGKDDTIGVYIDITEGPQWLVSKLNITGVSDANREAILGLVQSQEGQPFSEVSVAVDRDNVLDYYYNEGFSGATFNFSFTPAEQPNRVNLNYTVQEGRQRFLRSFLVSGLQATNPDLVSERLMLDNGDPLSRSRLLETQRRMYNLGIFARVDMALQNPQGDEKDKYVLLNLEEARKYTITTGFGAQISKIGGCRTCLGTATGQTGFSPRASLGVTRRNFLGEGHTISFQSRVSNVDRRGVISYEAPQFRGNSDVNLLFSGLVDDSRDIRTFNALRREGSVQVGQKLSKASTLLYRFSFRYVTVSDLVVNPDLIPLYSQPDRTGIFAINYVQDRRDDPTDARRGIFNTIDAGVAPTQFGSQTAFTHFLGHNATYYPMGFGSRYVLARSTTFGWQAPLKAGTTIPLAELFFGGGAQSHRGFPENQAGPRDLQTGFPIGGNAILVNQTELRFPLLGENVTGALFWDAGNVYSRVQNISFRVNQRSDSNFDYMVHAVGLGFRYRTPVGPVRIDLAYSINPPSFFGFKGTYDELVACSSANPPATGCVKTVQQLSHFQFHFSIGQAF